MKFIILLLASFISTFSKADFVEPPKFGNFQQLDQIQDVSGVNFCIYRRSLTGSQEPQYCINGNLKRHDLRGDVNVMRLFVEEKQIISGDGIYDKNGQKVIDLKTGKWAGDPTDLIGQAGEKGDPGESCTYDSQTRLINCGNGTSFSIDLLKGEKGDRGPQGDRGPRGFTGSKGETGDQGPRGFTGLKGDQGPRGYSCSPGTPIYPDCILQTGLFRRISESPDQLCKSAYAFGSAKCPTSHPYLLAFSCLTNKGNPFTLSSSMGSVECRIAYEEGDGILQCSDYEIEISLTCTQFPVSR